ncbi:PucR family transcriptional regulator [Bacillus rubiinfantis]|uniref:PucR family transcriptional regulator n=1 Tax=Bacillus rubiinfantis TaxID=1499680 RepID=UPI0005A6A0F7|nr:PucR family transcriptional regulator [Bacillus rubiinfantis]
MVTVKDLQNVLEENNVRIIAGKEGLERRIQFLTVQEFSFKSSRVQKDLFIMTTFFGFKNMEEIIQHFEWLALMGISGIGFHTVKYQEIPQKLIEIADKSGIPLLSIPKDLPYHIIFEKYNNLILQETSKVKNDIDKLNQEMLDSLVLEKDIHSIIQSVGKYLQVPIIHLNHEKEVVSMWGPPSISRTDLQNLVAGFLTNYPELMETVQASRKHLERAQLHKVKRLDSVLIIPLNNPLAFYGFLLVLNQTETVPFQESILKNTATALILDGIKKNQTIEYQKTKDIQQFEEIFLNNRNTPLRAEDFYYHIHHLHCIITAEPESLSKLKKSYQLFERSIRQIDRNALVWIFDKTLIALLQTEFNLPIKEIKNWKIGISNELKEITNESIQLAYEQAKIAMHFAALQKKTVCKWGELGVEQITYHLQKSALLKEFHYQYIQDLIQFDQVHQTELVKTLFVYLNTFFSLKESGEILHLHPNTVKYRIKKIQDIIPVDFQDSNQYINLMISLRSYFYQQECETQNLN